MSSTAVPQDSGAAQALAEARAVPATTGEGWVVRLVAALRRSPGLAQHLTLGAILVVILCICARTGIVPTRSYVHDVISFADNAWRVLWGQRPHVDYSSGLGPV